MKLKLNKLTVFLLLLFLFVGFVVKFTIFKNSEKSIANQTAIATLNSDELVNSFTLDEKKSNALYEGKIIEVTGKIKEISFINQRITVILTSNNKTFGVICDMNPNQKEKIKKLSINQKITVKGICKGFLKDVILLDCFIDFSANE